jgi:hypothetical protein
VTEVWAKAAPDIRPATAKAMSFFCMDLSPE